MSNTPQPSAASSPAPRLYTVPEAEKLVGLNLRYFISNKEDDFASTCVVRCGRAVRIREDRLREWIDRRTGVEPFKYSDKWRAKNLLAPVKRAATIAKKRKRRQPARARR